MVYNPADEDTEFNDALRKHGIIPPKAAAARTPSPPPARTLSDSLDAADTDELSELADEAGDSDTERFIQRYQRQRLAELRAEERGARFGSVRPIGRDDYTREITDASKADDEDEGSGTGVVCFLYKDGIPASVRLGQQVELLARRHTRTKFVSIVGDKCIPNYPDRNIPTLIMYRKGEMTNQVIAWGVARETSLEELEALLVASGVVNPALQTSTSKPRRRSSDDDEEDEADAPRRSIRSSNTTSRSRPQDDDSDLDL